VKAVEYSALGDNRLLEFTLIAEMSLTLALRPFAARRAKIGAIGTATKRVMTAFLMDKSPTSK
jgi:hypothetical protein